MNELSIRPLRSSRDRKRFVAFPYALYRDDPVWVPPLRAAVRHLISPEKNAFFEHGEVELFLAERGEQVVGRIAAIHNRTHDAHHKDGAGFFGLFECVDDQSVADALFHSASDWLRSRGLRVMRGPASFSLNDECGLVIDSFDRPPTILSPHNPPYYTKLIETAGFVKAKDLLLYESLAGDTPERLERAANTIAQRYDITLRPIRLSRFAEEVEKIKEVFNASWEKNWGFVPFSDAEIDALAAELKPIAIPDLVVFAEQGDRLVGMAVAVPDVNVALRKNRQGRLLPGVFRVLTQRRKIDRVRILVLGVIPEFRRKGVDSLMYHWIWTKAVENGVTWGEAGWILEDNSSMNNALLRMGFTPYKTLRLYDRSI